MEHAGVVAVHDAHAAENACALVFPACAHVGKQHALGHHDAQIVVHRRELGRLGVEDRRIFLLAERLHVDLGKHDRRLFVDLSADFGMDDAHHADLRTVHQNGVAVHGMLKRMCRFGRGKGERRVLHVVRDHGEHVAQRKVERLDVLRLAVERDGELLLLDDQIVLGHAGHDSADFKNAKIGRKAHVGLDLTELGGDHGVADGLDIRVGGVEELDVVLDLDAEIFQLVVVCPHIGVQLVEVVALDQNILDLFFIALHLVHADRVER